MVDIRTYSESMSTQIAVRLDDDELAALDAEVTSGRAASRSDAVRRGIAYLRREQRYRLEEATLLDLARRGESVYPDLDGLLDLPHPPLD
jgi:Arc/MetJ-type ribon-helix-helix transcriptional regulator